MAAARGLAAFARGWRGVARSVRIYHLDRAHLASLAALKRPFVPPGGLAFDIGAHVGDHARVFAGLGARVVAVEPQPRLATFLRLAFAANRRVTVVAAAVGAQEGTLRLLINPRNPTVSTGSGALVSAAVEAEAWAGERWDESATVPLTTLDALIARYGVPDTIKIDVEGLEDQVLAGLSHRVATLSFEFTTVQRGVGLAALERAEALGYRRFNLSLGATHAFHFAQPVDAATVAGTIADLPDAANAGDVYCFTG
ncbi:FkbM family methyltransferase [Acuticoccus sp. I52.16.1]|uniref:FkbM family methyltransferase n=1 Tax=Acuticoccus sp. I52.16.1 TaxID=2928472 RepID=UPI001FD090E5|nr:FkbM family methyltransferase [Acuticoccus sp. I52.16.1]UOM36422.1 FkbM family methyltransferase [Acuticoccus sp. I52.16.1]